ncbi:hypothetical protein [Nonomuraea sp. NPDC048916]|uniref:hypothetical protein n=1 Tax=Nonomuraea sp. NPDC048916 TaxID=3154232 RepID=UPI00340A622D
MIAVVVSLVAVVLLVLVVVALGMRSMNRRESSLPPERLKQMAEKEEMTHARSTDEFAAHEPRMSNFSPDFSPIDEPKPKPVRTGQRGKRGVDEWGNPSSDDEDEEFWANIRSDASEGGFGAGGTVAARKGASRPVEREQPGSDRARPAERERPARRRPAAAVDPHAATVQGPLPQRAVPAAASAGLADLVEPVQRPAAAASELADQRTVTFSAPPADVMSILGAGAKPLPAPHSAPHSAPRSSTGSFPATGGSGSPSSSGSFPAAASSGSLSTPAGGMFSPAGTGSFPVTPAAPIHGAPTSDPFPAYNGTGDQLGSGAAWPAPPASATSGSWAATTSPDILDDPAPSASGSWPAFEPQPPAAATYPSSYEVRSGWAVADDSEALTGPSPATSTPTRPARTVSAYDDVLSAPPPAQSIAYETGDFTSPGAQAAWPEGSAGSPSRPGYSETYGAPEAGHAARHGNGHQRTPEQDFPDYYR